MPNVLIVTFGKTHVHPFDGNCVSRFFTSVFISLTLYLIHSSNTIALVVPRIQFDIWFYVCSSTLRYVQEQQKKKQVKQAFQSF